MPNPNPDEDTEFNDVLRQHGILPPKPKELEISEDDIVNMMESVIQSRTGQTLDNKSLDEIDELEDDFDEAIVNEFRQKRIQEMKERASRARYGDMPEISEVDFVGEVTKAPADVWVVLLLFQQSVPACRIIMQHLQNLARKFPATKFLKIVATQCIRNYPDRNCPTLLIYHGGQMKRQLVGMAQLGGTNVTQGELEWQLKGIGAVESDMEHAPRRAQGVKDVMSYSLGINDDD